jgi:hypothetical protein
MLARGPGFNPRPDPGLLFDVVEDEVLGDVSVDVVDF